TIKHSACRAESLVGRQEFRKTIGDVVLISGYNMYRSFVKIYHRPNAIPFEFVDVFRTNGRLVGILGKHGLNVAVEIIDLWRIDAFQQPILLFDLVDPVFACDLATAQSEIESIFLFFGYVVLTQRVNPHIPRAVLTFWNSSVESQVLSRVIFRLNSKSLHTRMWRQPFRHSPRLQHAVLFKSQIIVKSRRMMAVHDEVVAAFVDDTRSWLRRF